MYAEFHNLSLRFYEFYGASEKQIMRKVTKYLRENKGGVNEIYIHPESYVMEHKGWIKPPYNSRQLSKNS